ncbi:MAG: ParB N-terminal domain-containing protein [Patescibacteria group bacterium]|nr:ParB N-terminal domain-containing protein [Patescibacteria group bacterium]
MARENLKWKTEKRRIDQLAPFEKNPRKISDEQIKLLKQSIERFDLVEIPAIDKDGTIIAGHQRLKIMQMLGRGKETIDVRVPNRKLTREEFEEYNLRSNKNVADWDLELLKNFDRGLLDFVGFNKRELDRIFDVSLKEDDFDAQAAYNAIRKAQSQRGDVYRLGDHRLMCGDSTSRDDVSNPTGGGGEPN